MGFLMDMLVSNVMEDAKSDLGGDGIMNVASMAGTPGQPGQTGTATPSPSPDDWKRRVAQMLSTFSQPTNLGMTPQPMPAAPQVYGRYH